MCNTMPVQLKVCNMRNVAMLLQDCKFHDTTDMEFRGLLTDSVEHSPSLEANQGIPHILWNIMFITTFIRVHSEVCRCKK